VSLVDGPWADVLNDAFETLNVLNASFRSSRQQWHLVDGDGDTLAFASVSFVAPDATKLTLVDGPWARMHRSA